MTAENGENMGGLKRVFNWLEKIGDLVNGAAKEAKRLGREDPRRVVHSLKVGLAITLLSFFYYFDFSYGGFGVSAMWAVMTVVVVFEFSVGATLGKGINRAIATLLGGALGIAAHKLASFAGEKNQQIESVILGISVFLIATLATFVRFFPKIKARYDYGLLIFILTFSLITVSGYREDEIIHMAHQRLSTILIGGAATVFICTVICPVWAGEDFHKLTAANIEKLAIFLEGFEREYFHVVKEKNEENKPLLSKYKSVLTSKGIEDSLVNFAKWEPRHGKFRYRQPWDLYLKVGSFTRQCAYKIYALDGYLHSDVQTPLESRARIQEQCTEMISECNDALHGLATAINTMTRPSSVDSHIVSAKTAAKKLKSMLKSNLWGDSDLLDIIPLLTVASLLIDIVSCSVKIAESVHELASKAKFKKPEKNLAKQASHDGRVTRSPSIGSHSFTITVE